MQNLKISKSCAELSFVSRAITITGQMHSEILISGHRACMSVLERLPLFYYYYYRDLHAFLLL